MIEVWILSADGKSVYSKGIVPLGCPRNEYRAYAIREAESYIRRCVYQPVSAVSFKVRDHYFIYETGVVRAPQETK